jgi:hypothetical protein
MAMNNLEQWYRDLPEDAPNLKWRVSPEELESLLHSRKMIMNNEWKMPDELSLLVRDLTAISYPMAKSEVKQRILQLLKDRDQELIEAIEGMKVPPYDYDKSDYDSAYVVMDKEKQGYNQTLQEVINLINNGKLSKT